MMTCITCSEAAWILKNGPFHATIQTELFEQAWQEMLCLTPAFSTNSLSQGGMCNEFSGCFHWYTMWSSWTGPSAVRRAHERQHTLEQRQPQHQGIYKKWQRSTCTTPICEKKAITLATIWHYVTPTGGTSYRALSLSPSNVTNQNVWHSQHPSLCAYVLRNAFTQMTATQKLVAFIHATLECIIIIINNLTTPNAGQRTLLYFSS